MLITDLSKAQPAPRIARTCPPGTRTPGHGVSRAATPSRRTRARQPEPVTPAFPSTMMSEHRSRPGFSQSRRYIAVTRFEGALACAIVLHIGHHLADGVVDAGRFAPDYLTEAAEGLDLSGFAPGGRFNEPGGTF